MKEITAGKFQQAVDEMLVRNRSIIDLITKFQVSNARVNRTIVKAVTHCGCVKINASKQIFPEDGDLEEARKSMQTHLEGQMCENCRDLVEKEIGSNLFYLASICEALDLNLSDILEKEHERMTLLGKFSLR